MTTANEVMGDPALQSTTTWLGSFQLPAKKKRARKLPPPKSTTIQKTSKNYRNGSVMGSIVSSNNNSNNDNNNNNHHHHHHHNHHNHNDNHNHNQPPQDSLTWQESGMRYDAKSKSISILKPWQVGCYNCWRRQWASGGSRKE